MDMTEVQQTDLDTGKPAFWDDGRPKMMFRVVIQTDLRDPAITEDDGRRAVYLRGSRKPESKSSLAAVIQAAIKATGKASIDVGGMLTLTYLGDGERSQKAFNPPKLYAALYAPPSVDLGPEPEDRREPDHPQAVQKSVDGTLAGWLNGKPITATMIASMEAAGVNVKDLDGFQPVA